MSVQLTPVERKQRKRFTAQQKLAILREWEASGNGVEVAERHGIHPMTLYRWRKRLETGAAEFLVVLTCVSAPGTWLGREMSGQSSFLTRLNNALPWNVTANSPLDQQVAKQYEQLKNWGLPMDQIRAAAWGPLGQKDRLGLVGKLEAKVGGKVAKDLGKDAANSGALLSSASSFFTANSLLNATAQYATAQTDLEQTEAAFKMLSAVIPFGGLAWELGQILGGQW